MKNSSPRANVACALAACLLTVAACKTSAPPEAPTAAPAAAPSAAAPSAAAEGRSADQAEGAKLSAAIECLNRHSRTVFEARDSYLKSVDATGKSREKKPVLLQLYGIDQCVREVKEAGALTPAVPALDAAAAAYTAALTDVAKIYEGDLIGYYKKGDDVDDGGKKAIALYPKVVDAFKSFATAHKELSTTVKTLNRQRREAKLAAREKAQGRTLAVLIDSMMLEGETLVQMTSSPDVAQAALDAQIAVYAKLVDEVDARADAHKDETSQFGSLANIKNYDKTFLASAKVVARTLRDKGKPSGSQREEVSRQYNSLVDNYNNH
jgi:hypothetical protein